MENIEAATTDAPETAYKLHFQTKFQGIPVSVENRKGSYRRGVDSDGKPWEIKMDYHYGRIPRTRGTDGDMVDVFIGPDKNAPRVYVIEQVWPDTGVFDEHKCMLGFKTKAEAIRGYKSQYNRPGFYGGCQTMTVEEFKGWLKEQSPKKVERRNLEHRVVSGQRVLEDRVKDEYMGWDKLVKKLMAEGKSKESAEKIAATIGRKKYGKSGMAAKSAAGRDSDILPTLQEQGTHTGADYSQFSPKEMALGILVEKEHADDILDRLEIAADHLVESPKYYTENKHFMAELRREYGEGLKSAYQGALKMVQNILSGHIQDSSSVNTVIIEALATPIIKKLMKDLGFKRLIWKGSGWVIPIGLDEYGNYLRMVPRLKVYDRMLQKFGYEISLSPGWFKIVPVER